MSIQRSDIIIVEPQIATILESAQVEEIIGVFLESDKLEAGEGVKMFPPVSWDIIHTNAPLLFGIRVVSSLNTNREAPFLCNLSKYFTTYDCTTLVKIVGNNVLALSPGTINVRRQVLDSIQHTVTEPIVDTSTIIEADLTETTEVSNIDEVKPKRSRKKKAKEVAD